MAIKVLQQSTLRRLVVTIFYFCCFQCDNTPLTGVITYVFLHLLLMLTHRLYVCAVFR